ncbi:hypothetical protein EMGBS4_16810 [Acidimicrobiaceae bacterium]|nr:hypothetical protein EMGBS4_16810 [Acidimicrobiaceae bacterium]
MSRLTRLQSFSPPILGDLIGGHRATVNENRRCTRRQIMWGPQTVTPGVVEQAFKQWRKNGALNLGELLHIFFDQKSCRCLNGGNAFKIRCASLEFLGPVSLAARTLATGNELSNSGSIYITPAWGPYHL